MTLANVGVGLRTLMLANGTISSAVGGQRIFPTIMPQGETNDSIVYTRITEFEGMTFEHSTGLPTARYQIDCWSESFDDATTLANMVKELLCGFSGRVDYTGDHVDIQLIELANAREDYDGATFMYRVSKDYFVIYEDRNA